MGWLGKTLGKIGNAALGGIPSLIGGAVDAVGGVISNNQNNKFQAEQNQLGREFQERMLQKQMDYQSDMWSKTNEYNSAKNQVARYQEAGLNPQLLMGQGSAGTAQSQSSPSLGNAYQSTSTPYQNVLSGMGQGLTDFYNNKIVREAQARKSIAEAEGVEIDNETRRLDNATRRKNINADTSNKEQDTRTKETYNKYADEMFSSDAKYKQRGLYTQHLQQTLMSAEITEKNFNNSKLSERYGLEVQQKVAQTALLQAQKATEGERKTLTKNQAEKVVRDKILTNEQIKDISRKNRISETTVVSQIADILIKTEKDLVDLKKSGVKNLWESGNYLYNNVIDTKQMDGFNKLSGDAVNYYKYLRILDDELQR